MFESDQWLWSIDHRQPCKVVEATSLWGEVAYQVWLPSTDSVVRIPGDRLKPLDTGDASAPARVRYALYAGRIINLQGEDVLLAPASAAVVALPHQLRALRRAVSQDRVRFLLADEVGLGKTIEAGLIMRELKLRGLVRRILVVAPKGLITQWIAEMQTHFGEEFRHFAPADFAGYRRIAPHDNVWRAFDQVICSLDSVKPLESRQGWSLEEVRDFNRERFEDLVSAGWDLIVVDESHRIGGSSDQVARYQLGRGLADASPYLLLLSATPHQGKTDAFHRLVSLLDKNAFPEPASVTRERVQPYVIRTEKRQAIDANGSPLFRPRLTKLVGVTWDGHEDQHQLYEAVTEYVRAGYNQAIREKKTYVGFLMILMQRLVTSSTRAIICTLERRLGALQSPTEPLAMVPAVPEEEWNDLDGQDQLDSFLKLRLAALKNERAEVELLLNAARKVEARGPDAKAEALLDWIYRFQKDDGDPDVKVLVFTEFVPTQQMLAEFLEARGISVACLNGSLTLEERQDVQQAFARQVRVLIATDAGGEGLNLQFCHIVVNFDMPWNPMRLEQRIGRVDRIGQKGIVRAINFLFSDSVEFRVREVLEEKLAVILTEFGVDKTSDVLDSAEAAQLFDGLYVSALLHPDRINQSVDQVTETIKSRAGDAHTKNSMLNQGELLSPGDAREAIRQPLGDWVVRMTENYLDTFGGRYEAELDCLRIQWPGETEMRRYSLPNQIAAAAPNSELLRLDHPKVQGILTRLPRFVAGMPIPWVRLPSMPTNIAGFWSLWEIRIITQDRQRRKIMPLFVHDDGRALAPTARFIWEQLCIEYWEPEPKSFPVPDLAIIQGICAQADQQSQEIYLEMRQRHSNQLQLETEKLEHRFKSRRKQLQGIGLPEVREFRLRQLAAEEAASVEELRRQSRVLPELTPLLLLRIG